MVKLNFVISVHVLGCLLLTMAMTAQNLVKNPSFELYGDCPRRLGNFNSDVQSWSTPTEGSTDYFNECSTIMGTPKNFNGVQPADFGKGYAGLYLYAPDNYREYLQAELSEPLAKDVTYMVSFYVSLAERSDFAIKEFGVLFSKENVHFPIKKELSKKLLYGQKGNSYHFLEITYSNFYDDTSDWILVHTEFVAKGYERFLTLGNFKNNARTRMFKTKKNAKQGAYYYVDMVLVEPTLAISQPLSEERLTDTGNPATFELDKSHVFENVLFAFDTYNLAAPAKTEIRKIFEFLNKNDYFHIKIDGHTDSVGTPTYNQRLSTKRARAVADYLIALGLNEEQVTFQGHGGSSPIAANASYQGRQMNRRVEFTISSAQAALRN